jgi:hypothetical protein
MSISAYRFRQLAHTCVSEAELSTDMRKQTLLEFARPYTSLALRIEVNEAASLVRNLIRKFHAARSSRAKAGNRATLRLVVSR